MKVSRRRKPHVQWFLMVLQQPHPDVLTVIQQETNILLYILSDLFTDFKEIFLSLISKFRKAPLPFFPNMFVYWFLLCLFVYVFYVFALVVPLVCHLLISSSVCLIFRQFNALEVCLIILELLEYVLLIVSSHILGVLPEKMSVALRKQKGRQVERSSFNHMENHI